MFENTGLSKLLDRLEERGWDYSQRAIVAFEWRRYVLTKWDHPNRYLTDMEQKLYNMSSVIKLALEDLDKPEDLEIYNRAKFKILRLDKQEYLKIKKEVGSVIEFLDYQNLMGNKEKEYASNILKKCIGWDLLDKNISANRAVEIVEKFDYSIVEILKSKGITTQDFISDLSGMNEHKIDPLWKQLRENIQKKEDYDNFIGKNKQADYTKAHQYNFKNIQEARDRLASVCIRANLASLTLNPFDVDDIESISNIVYLIEEVTKKWEKLVDNDEITVGMGLLNLNIAAPYTGSSAYYTNITDINKKNKIDYTYIELYYLLGLEGEQVLSHELWHMHDNLLSMYFNEQIQNKYLAYASERGNLPSINHLIEKIKDGEDHLNDEMIKEIEENFLDKWIAFLPQDKGQLKETYNQWKIDGDDRKFLLDCVDFFDNSPFYESKEFRSILILSELKAIDKIKKDKKSNLILDVNNFFNDIKDKNYISLDYSIYVEDYLSNNCELSARSFQNIFRKQKQGRQMLMFGYQDIQKTTNIWKEMFQSEDIKNAYRQLNEAILASKIHNNVDNMPFLNKDRIKRQTDEPEKNSKLFNIQ